MDRIHSGVTDYECVSESCSQTPKMQESQLSGSRDTYLRSGSQKLLQNCSLSVCHQTFDSIHYLSKIKVFSENTNFV